MLECGKNHSQPRERKNTMSMTENHPKTLLAMTIPEAAKEARVSPRTVATWIAKGQLQSSKIGRVRRILRDDLRSVLAGEDHRSKATNEMPTGLLIERRMIEELVGEQIVATLIELGKLRYAVGKVLRRDIQTIFEAAARS